MLPLQLDSTVSNGLVSLHIRSMWETICDAWACWSGWNFGPNSKEYPLFWSTEYPPPPPPPPVPPLPSPIKMKIVRESKSESFRIPPQNCQLSESPNPRVSEYPPNENFHSPNPRVSEYLPPNENCHRVQIREFQNTPPKWKLSPIPNQRVSEYPPSKLEKLQISNFRIV